MFVFVDDVEGYGLAGQFVAGGRGEDEVEVVAALEEVAAFGGPTVDFDGVFLDEPLNESARELLETALEVLVDASVGRGTFDEELEVLGGFVFDAVVVSRLFHDVLVVGVMVQEVVVVGAGICQFVLIHGSLFLKRRRLYLKVHPTIQRCRCATVFGVSNKMVFDTLDSGFGGNDRFDDSVVL